jgi:hypothetical protein
LRGDFALRKIFFWIVPVKAELYKYPATAFIFGSRAMGQFRKELARAYWYTTNLSRQKLRSKR